MHDKVDPLSMLRTRQRIFELYRELGYGDEVLYLTSRTLISRLRRELRRCTRRDSDTANRLAQVILDNWRLFRRYGRRQYRREL